MTITRATALPHREGILAKKAAKPFDQFSLTNIPLVSSYKATRSGLSRHRKQPVRA